jgi:hypothetical protein
MKCAIVQGSVHTFTKIYGFSGELMLLEDDENVDIGFFMGTITGYRTKNACPQYVLFIFLVSPYRDRGDTFSHLIEGGNGHDGKLAVGTWIAERK